jgi:hypothetical protein
MRVRTAAGLAIAIVAAKAALTWVALIAWASLPERPGFVGHWRIQLGTLSSPAGSRNAATSRASAIRS